jgi:hypothetical protein
MRQRTRRRRERKKKSVSNEQSINQSIDVGNQSDGLENVGVEASALLFDIFADTLADSIDGHHLKTLKILNDAGVSLDPLISLVKDNTISLSVFEGLLSKYKLVNKKNIDGIIRKAPTENELLLEVNKLHFLEFVTVKFPYLEKDQIRLLFRIIDNGFPIFSVLEKIRKSPQRSIITLTIVTAACAKGQEIQDVKISEYLSSKASADRAMNENNNFDNVFEEEITRACKHGFALLPSDKTDLRKRCKRQCYKLRPREKDKRSSKYGRASFITAKPAVLKNEKIKTNDELAGGVSRKSKKISPSKDENGAKPKTSPRTKPKTKLQVAIAMVARRVDTVKRFLFRMIMLFLAPFHRKLAKVYGLADTMLGGVLTDLVTICARVLRIPCEGIASLWGVLAKHIKWVTSFISLGASKISHAILNLVFNLKKIMVGFLVLPSSLGSKGILICKKVLLKCSAFTVRLVASIQIFFLSLISYPVSAVRKIGITLFGVFSRLAVKLELLLKSIGGVIVHCGIKLSRFAHVTLRTPQRVLGGCIKRVAYMLRTISRVVNRAGSKMADWFERFFTSVNDRICAMSESVSNRVDGVSKSIHKKRKR